jgi:DNA-binding NarL/FixJ family response regulator
MNTDKITIAIADDHQLFLKSLCILISSLGQFDIVADALNGKDLLQKLEAGHLQPDVALIDVNMPVMDGVETAAQLAQKYPLTKIVALSMKDDDNTIISMLKAGCCAYLLKDIHPTELERALVEIHNKGFYNADTLNLRYRRLIVKSEADKAFILSEREKQFLQLACSDLTYKQIAVQMHVSERTVDGYREALFEKLNVQSRTGMALEAIRRNLVTL